MSDFPITIKPFGDRAVLIEWPAKIDEIILNDILPFKAFLENLFEDDWEFVPAYNSLTLIKNDKIIAFDKLKEEIKKWYSKSETKVKQKRFLWKLPVCYDLDFGIDLEEIATELNFSIKELIQKHSEQEYTLYGIGFLPGFMYLGGLPDYLETKRKSVPRLKVEKGAVGLAAKQTGVYPQTSPGGWNIIGNCPIPIFNVNAETPCFVNVGDKIKFVPIARAEYDLRKIEAEVGIYKPEKIEIDA